MSTVRKSTPKGKTGVSHPTFLINRNKPIGTRLYEVWTRYQGEFALSMLETWEVIMLHLLLVFLIGLLYIAASSYLPSHLRYISSRARYYLSGQQGDSLFKG